ncbi:MAG: hypothetical protein E7610_04005 [Ruminococcaceae bacterium]|nr:hypothetical protein [Oscillospiraceae bacterium]
MTQSPRARMNSTVHKPPIAKDDDQKHRLYRIARPIRGALWCGIAFLLGSCSALWSAAPLGLALLSAASSYTWYIFAGLLLSAIFRPVFLSGWAWGGVYLLCVILRLTIRFFVDPPLLPDGRPCRGQMYLRLCWRSFKQNVGLLPFREEDISDYYPGSTSKNSSGHTTDTPIDKTAASLKSTRAPVSEVSPRLFWEHPLLRMLTAAVCGLIAGIFIVITGGYHLYDLLSALALLILTPCATLLLVSCFGETGMVLLFSTDPLRLSETRPDIRTSASSFDSVTKRFHVLPLCSVCFLIGCTVYAARAFTPTFGSPYLRISLTVLLGLVVSLTASSRLGFVSGLAVSVITGMAASPALSPLFILCAGVYGLITTRSPRWAAAAGCVAGGIWCVTVTGILSFLPIFPAVLLAPPVFFLSERIWSSLPPLLPGKENADADLEDMTRLLSNLLSGEVRLKSGASRLQSLAEVFTSLSQRFYGLSGQLKRPRMQELRSICDECFGKHCAKCSKRDICWGAEYDRTLEAQARLTARLHAGERATLNILPDSLREFCPRMETVIGDINDRYAHLTERLLRNEQTDTFAADYASMAALLTDILEEDRRELMDFTYNRETADAVYELLANTGIPVRGVVVVGKPNRRRVIIRLTDLDVYVKNQQRILRELEALCGTPLDQPLMEYEGTGGVLTFSSKAALSVQYSGSTVPSDRAADDPMPPPLTHETPKGAYAPPAVCGDHIALFRTDNAYLYALISDGMGAGEEASMTSDICTMFLEKMLAAGNKVDISLRMLDTYVRSKNRGTWEECSATVDLMELDLTDGQAVFAKYGAAPTYVVREGKVYKLQTPTMPIGILSDLPRHELRFRTHPGDVLVMVSDGITLGNDECPWLMDLLTSPMPASMDSLRSDIIKRALSAGSEDDLSAIAIRVDA